MLRSKSVRGKLLLVVLATAASALLMAGAAMAFYDLHTFRQTSVADLKAQADILGLAAAPALQFEDPASARDYLKLLAAKPTIISAAIYTAKGDLFASYEAAGRKTDFPKIPQSDGYVIDGNRLTLFKRILGNGEILGTVYIDADYGLLTRLADYVGILTVILVLSLLAALLVSRRLQRTLTQPILDIASVAGRVMKDRDFSLRAKRTSDDEIGELVDAFNGMLAEIGERTDVLEASNRRLQREVEERARAEAARKLSERRNRVLVSAITQVVWTADDAGRFVDEQDSWAEYTGQTREEYKAFGWRGAFDDASVRVLDRAWARSAADGQALEAGLRLWHRASGRYRHVNLRAVPLLESDGAVREWTGAIQDVDDQRSAEEKLRDLNEALEQRVAARTEELEAANKDLESFSYSVSHDLRAPIRAISGFCTLMCVDHEQALDAEASRKLGIIKSEANRMGALIDDLLAFSRLGRKALQPVELGMADLVQRVYGRLADDGVRGDIEFRLGRLPDAVGDRSLFEQVWVNLLSNAIKFSSKRENPLIEVGGITAEHEHVYFVRDNGAGFDNRYKENLFGVFQRLHHDSEFPGTGVGLALVHRIVARHGGRVWADGKVDEGATFHFTIPTAAFKEHADAAV